MFISALRPASCLACLKSPKPCRRPRGFTLIEILVVLVISVGLVITMALLFRAVARTTVLLRGGNEEWLLQSQLREQLRHVLIVPSEPPLSGNQKEVMFTTWRSQRDGHRGKPVIAQYRYEASEHTVYYRESEMPAWWPAPPKTAEIRRQLQKARETRLVAAIDDLEFQFLATETGDISVANPETNWQKTEIPRVIQLSFTRAERRYNFYFETRGLAAQTANRR